MPGGWQRDLATDRMLTALGASKYRRTHEPGRYLDPDRVYKPDEVADLVERWQAESKLRVVRQCQDDGCFETPADEAEWRGFSQQLHGPRWIELSQELEWG